MYIYIHIYVGASWCWVARGHCTSAAPEVQGPAVCNSLYFVYATVTCNTRSCHVVCMCACFSVWICTSRICGCISVCVSLLHLMHVAVTCYVSCCHVWLMYECISLWICTSRIGGCISVCISLLHLMHVAVTCHVRGCQVVCMCVGMSVWICTSSH